jgi:predicted RNA binding protein YcfA (HicA-like mRNA interferase family)
MTAGQVIKKLEDNGWVLNRIRGSHHSFKKPGMPRPVTVPVHGNQEMGSFAKVILKQAGIS